MLAFTQAREHILHKNQLPVPCPHLSSVINTCQLVTVKGSVWAGQLTNPPAFVQLGCTSTQMSTHLDCHFPQILDNNCSLICYLGGFHNFGNILWICNLAQKLLLISCKIGDVLVIIKCDKFSTKSSGEILKPIKRKACSQDREFDENCQCGEKPSGSQTWKPLCEVVQGALSNALFPMSRSLNLWKAAPAYDGSRQYTQHKIHDRLEYMGQTLHHFQPSSCTALKG